MDRAQRRDLSSGSDGFEADVGGLGGQVSGLSECQETRSQDISPYFV